MSNRNYSSALSANTPTGTDVDLKHRLHSKMRVRSGIAVSTGFAVLTSIMFLLQLVFGAPLTNLGIHPLDVSSLWHIVTSPFLHASASHLWGNLVPAVIFSFLIGLSGKRVFFEVTAIVMVVGGLGTWLVGGVGTNHIGASGLVYGWLGYLIIRGFVRRDFWQIVLGIGLAFFYSGYFWGMLPIQAGISWQGHLCGAIGGAIAGKFISSGDLESRRALKNKQRSINSAQF